MTNTKHKTVGIDYELPQNESFWGTRKMSVIHANMRDTPFLVITNDQVINKNTKWRTVSADSLIDPETVVVDFITFPNVWRVNKGRVVRI